MSSANSSINQIYKSRKNILEILNDIGYEVDEHIDFSVNEIDAMLNNNQLDMLLKTKDDKKTYIKYSLTSKQVRWQNTLDETIEDLYYIDNTLTKDDDLIIIINEEPNDNLINKLKYIYDTDGIFIVVHNIARLQFNILNHTLVPKHKVLNDKEKEEIKNKYSVMDDSQFPDISRFSPVSMVISMRPGELCEITRSSKTAINSKFYRICSS